MHSRTISSTARTIDRGAQNENRPEMKRPLALLAATIVVTLSAPVGAPAAVLQKPEVRQQIERQAMDVNFLPAEAMGVLAREQTEVWRSLTKAAGMTPE